MALISVDSAALGAAAGSIGDIAATFEANRAPAVSASSAQVTAAAVNAVHDATDIAESTMAVRLRATACATAAGGTAFATTEQSSTCPQRPGSGRRVAVPAVAGGSPFR